MQQSEKPTVPDITEYKKQILNSQRDKRYLWRLTDDILVAILNDKDCFEKLNTLKHLHLSNNNITKIPDKFFELKGLEKLDLSHTDIKTIPKKIRELKGLEELDLSHTDIKTIPDEICELKGLKKLNLSHTNIKTIPEKICELEKLEELDLSRTKITEIPDIGKLKGLRKLDLSHTEITKIPEKIRELQPLVELKLSNENIKEYTQQILQNQHNQLHLSGLTDDILVAILNDRDCFKQLKSLEYLRLSNNNLTRLPGKICELKGLKHLELSGNPFRTFPTEVLKLNLTSLSLSHTDIKTIPKKIRELKGLQYLDLSHNKNITEIPDKIYELKGLQYLNLSHHESITEIPEKIYELKELQVLDLSHTKIIKIPDKICELKELQILRLNNNDITKIPDKICELKELQILDLSHTKIKTIPDKIGELKKLEELNLSNNDITKIPDTTRQLTELQKLNLANNNITDIDETLLRDIYNNINNIRLKAISNNNRLRVEFNLKNNPLSATLRRLITSRYSNDNIISYNLGPSRPGSIKPKEAMKILGLDTYEDFFNNENEWLQKCLQTLWASDYLNTEKQFIGNILTLVFDKLSSNDDKEYGAMLQAILSASTGDCATPIITAMKQIEVIDMLKKQQEVSQSTLIKVALSAYINKNAKRYGLNVNEAIEAMHGFLDILFLKNVEETIGNSVFFNQSEKDSILKNDIPKNRDEALFQDSSSRYTEFGIFQLYKHMKIQRTELFKIVCKTNNGELTTPREIDYDKLNSIVKQYKATLGMAEKEYNECKALYQQMYALFLNNVVYDFASEEWKNLCKTNIICKIYQDSDLFEDTFINNILTEYTKDKTFLEKNSIEKLIQDVNTIYPNIDEKILEEMNCDSVLDFKSLIGVLENEIINVERKTEGSSIYYELTQHVGKDQIVTTFQRLLGKDKKPYLAVVKYKAPQFASNDDISRLSTDISSKINAFHSAEIRTINEKIEGEYFLQAAANNGVMNSMTITRNDEKLIYTSKNGEYIPSQYHNTHHDQIWEYKISDDNSGQLSLEPFEGKFFDDNGTIKTYNNREIVHQKEDIGGASCETIYKDSQSIKRTTTYPNGTVITEDLQTNSKETINAHGVTSKIKTNDANDQDIEIIFDIDNPVDGRISISGKSEQEKLSNITTVQFMKNDGTVVPMPSVVSAEEMSAEELTWLQKSINQTYVAQPGIAQPGIFRIPNSEEYLVIVNKNNNIGMHIGKLNQKNQFQVKKIIFGDGTLYRGQIVQGKLNGLGEKIDILGRIEKGRYSEGLRHGEITYIGTNNQEKWRGSFLHNSKHGIHVTQNTMRVFNKNQPINNNHTNFQTRLKVFIPKVIESIKKKIEPFLVNVSAHPAQISSSNQPNNEREIQFGKRKEIEEILTQVLKQDSKELRYINQTAFWKRDTINMKTFEMALTTKLKKDYERIGSDEMLDKMLVFKDEKYSIFESENGSLDNMGIFCNQDSVFHGTFLNGKQYGLGVTIDKDNNIVIGSFSENSNNNISINSNGVISSEKCDIKEALGYFKDKNQYLTHQNNDRKLNALFRYVNDDMTIQWGRGKMIQEFINQHNPQNISVESNVFSKDVIRGSNIQNFNKELVKERLKSKMNATDIHANTETDNTPLIMYAMQSVLESMPNRKELKIDDIKTYLKEIERELVKQRESIDENTVKNVVSNITADWQKKIEGERDKMSNNQNISMVQGNDIEQQYQIINIQSNNKTAIFNPYKYSNQIKLSVPDQQNRSNPGDFQKQSESFNKEDLNNSSQVEIEIPNPIGAQNDQFKQGVDFDNKSGTYSEQVIDVDEDQQFIPVDENQHIYQQGINSENPEYTYQQFIPVDENQQVINFNDQILDFNELANNCASDSNSNSQRPKSAATPPKNQSNWIPFSRKSL